MQTELFSLRTTNALEGNHWIQTIPGEGWASSDYSPTKKTGYWVNHFFFVYRVYEWHLYDSQTNQGGETGMIRASQFNIIEADQLKIIFIWFLLFLSDISTLVGNLMSQPSLKKNIRNLAHSRKDKKVHNFFLMVKILNRTLQCNSGLN